MRHVPEQEEKKAEGFDLIVTHRDVKTGLVTHSNPYILRVCGEQGNSVKARYWERPKGSGNLFDKKGQPVGRWDASKPEGERFIKGAKHIEWVAPLTEDQKIAQENAALKAELAQLKAEQAKKAAPAKKDQGA